MLSVVSGSLEQARIRYHAEAIIKPSFGDGDVSAKEVQSATTTYTQISVPVSDISGKTLSELKDRYYCAARMAYEDAGCRRVAVSFFGAGIMACPMEKFIGAAIQGISEMLSDYMADSVMSIYLAMDAAVMHRLEVEGEQKETTASVAQKRTPAQQSPVGVFNFIHAGGTSKFKPENYKKKPDKNLVPASCYIPNKQRKTPSERLANWYDENKEAYKLPDVRQMIDSLVGYMSDKTCLNLLNRNRKGNVQRRNAILLAMAMNLTVEQTREMMAVCGFYFGSEDEDRIFEYCINTYPGSKRTDAEYRIDMANEILFNSGIVPFNDEYSIEE